MATEVIMPALELAQDTGKLLRWLRPAGASVAKGEPIMEIETDKVTVEVEAPAGGTLAEIRAAEGDDVPVGHVVALILAPGESPAEAPVEKARPRVSPKARRLAKERGVDLAGLGGSGPGGTIVAEDVEGARPAPAATPSGSLWRRMAERTTASWQAAPHFYLQREVDASSLVARRDEGTVTDLLVQAAAAALREHPQVNGRWRDDAVALSDGIHVGLAVAVEDGLIVPVIRDADRLSLAEIGARRLELVTATREGTLEPDDVAGGTFTISNLGMFGVDSFQAVLNPPQAAILAVGRIRERAVVAAGEIVARPVLALTLSFDHRVVDGARGARFLETLANLLEEEPVPQ